MVFIHGGYRADVQELSLPGLNHFTIVDQLTRDDNTLFASVRDALLGTT